MDVKEATQTARNYVVDAFADDEIITMTQKLAKGVLLRLADENAKAVRNWEHRYVDQAKELGGIIINRNLP